MSDISTFGAFTTARLGIYAAQKGLGVTGNNIANINTRGYTRQTLDQISLKVGSNDHYQSKNTARPGSGVLCVGVSQIRDPYLDIRYRSELANVGAMDAKLSGLDALSAILDEVGKGDEENGIIAKQLEDLLGALQDFNTENAGQDDFDTLVRTAASTLVKQLNSYAGRLEEVQNDTVDKLRSGIEEVNSLLTRIQNLNASIRKSEIHGDSALEMRDQRNLAIDALSQLIKIDVTYTTEDLDGLTVEKLVIKLGNANPDRGVTTDSATLVDGIYVSQLLTPQENGGGGGAYLDHNGDPTDDPRKAAQVFDDYYNVTLGALADKNGQVQAGSTPVELDDNDLYGSLQSMRELLTERGEFASGDEIDNIDENAAIKRGIPYYRDMLDALARQLATKFNEANTGGQVYPDGTATGETLGGPLFSNSAAGDDTTDIRADNISISASWANGSVRIVNSFVKPGPDQDTPSQANDNIQHLISIMTSKFDYSAQDIRHDAEAVNPYFHGSFSEMFANITGTLGKDTMIASSLLDGHYASAIELDTSRDSVSSVDLNDEAMSLMQYQKSYSAAARLMTTLDEVLDKLINGTGVAGR